VFIVLEKLVFRAEFQIAKPTCRPLAGWLEIDEAFADFDAKVRGDALGDICRNLGLTRSAILWSNYAGDGWQ
jgi:hypothetical protein